MKVNNYIKILSTVLIMFGYSNDGYSVENQHPKLRRVNAVDYDKYDNNNSESNEKLETLDQKIKYQSLQRKNAFTKDSIDKLEKDLPKMEATSNLAQSLVSLYEKVADDVDVMLNSKELKKNLKKLGKDIQNEANAKLKEVEDKISKLCNILLDNIDKSQDITDEYIKQLQDYIYNLKEYFSGLENKYIEQNTDVSSSIEDVMIKFDKNGQQQPNLSNCVEKINGWIYCLEPIENNYNNLLNIK